jgi:hypothetical protein
MTASKKKLREVTFGQIESSGTETDHPSQLSSPNSTQYTYTFFSPTSVNGSRLQSAVSSKKKDLSYIFKNSYGLKCASGNEERECFCYGDRKAGYGEACTHFEFGYIFNLCSLFLPSSSIIRVTYAWDVNVWCTMTALFAIFVLVWAIERHYRSIEAKTSRMV